MAWLAILQAVGKSNQQASALKIQKAQLGVQAATAKLDGAAYGMNLNADFNKAMASDAVIGAAQMRRGGSVAAVASAAEKKFNWDIDFAEMGTEMRVKGIDADISQYDTAIDTTATAGYASAALGAFNSYQKSSANKSLLAPKTTPKEVK